MDGEKVIDNILWLRYYIRYPKGFQKMISYRFFPALGTHSIEDIRYKPEGF